MEYLIAIQIFAGFATFVYLKSQKLTIKLSLSDEDGNEVNIKGEIKNAS